MDNAFANLVIIYFQLLPEYLRQPVGRRVSRAEYKVLARRDPYLDSSYSRAVLAAVVLFFHQQKELVKAVDWRAILLPIVLQRLEQAYKRYAALVFNRIAHNKIEIFAL